MRISILLRGALVALIVLFGVGLQSAKADSGNITLRSTRAAGSSVLQPAAARSPSAAAAIGLVSGG